MTSPPRGRSTGATARTNLRLLVALGAAGLVWSAGLSAQSPSRAQATRQPGASGAERTLTVGGQKRTYVVHDFAETTVPAPVVIVLHGGGGNAQNAISMTGFDRVAARDRFIVVYPDGTAGENRGRLAAARDLLLTWNAGHCCASAMVNHVDDVGFISAIIDTLAASGRLDRSRVYVTGMSNGAMLAHRLGRELSTKIAAIAPVVGAVFGDEPPPQAPMPALIIVGADDETVPPQGGALQLRVGLGNRSAANRDVAPAVDQARYWARYNKCGQPARTITTAWTRDAWTACSTGAPVVFYSVHDNGHAWPGGQAGRRRGAAQPTQAFNATDTMWAFFQQHRRAN